MYFKIAKDQLRIEFNSGESVYAEQKYVVGMSDAVRAKKKDKGRLIDFKLSMPNWRGKPRIENATRVRNPVLFWAKDDGYMELSGIHGGDILNVTLEDAEELALFRGDAFLACAASVKFDVYDFVLGGPKMDAMEKFQSFNRPPSAGLITKLTGPGNLFLRLSSKGQVSSTGGASSMGIDVDKLVGFSPNLQHQMPMLAILEAKKEDKKPVMDFQGLGRVVYTSEPIPKKL